MGDFNMDRDKVLKVDKAVDDIAPFLEYSADCFISTDSLLKCVEKKLDAKISYRRVSFKIFDDDSVLDYGAMMCTKMVDDKKTATIILNDDKALEFQRFSLAHELGHLMTNVRENLWAEKEYVVSTHIRYDLTSFGDEECEDPFIEQEQLANIFALKVLMPRNPFFGKLLSGMPIYRIAECFGVTEGAVRSRAILGF